MQELSHPKPPFDDLSYNNLRFYPEAGAEADINIILRHPIRFYMFFTDDDVVVSVACVGASGVNTKYELLARHEWNGMS